MPPMTKALPGIISNQQKRRMSLLPLEDFQDKVFSLLQIKSSVLDLERVIPL
jgi:hypothetical protein